MKRLIVLGAVLCLVFGARAAMADEKAPPIDAKAKGEQAAPAVPAPPKTDGVVLKQDAPGVTVDSSKLGKQVRKDAGQDCGTTACPPFFCFDESGGQDTCHHAAGGTCSGSIDTGLHSCDDNGVPRHCTGGQTVHLQTCPCSCLGNACGTHLLFEGCH